jgi:hypothetical protein
MQEVRFVFLDQATSFAVCNQNYGISKSQYYRLEMTYIHHTIDAITKVTGLWNISLGF